MLLKTLSIKDFRSIKECLIDFKNKNYLIIGKNNDDGLDSNGSGKTNILDAIYWCLFNKSLKKNTGANGVIRKGKKNCIVTLDLEHLAKNIIIQNSRKNGVKIYVDGKRIKKLKPFNYISEVLLGIDSFLFDKIIFLRDKNKLSFCSLTDKQIKHLLDILISDEVNNKINIAFEKNNIKCKKVEKFLNLYPDKLDLLEENLTNVIKKILFLKDNEDFERKISKYEKEIEKYNDLILKKKKFIKIIESEISLKKKQYDKEINIILNEIDSIDKTLKTYNNKLLFNEKNKLKFNGLINSFKECPKCGYEFNIEKNISKMKLNIKLRQTQKEILKLVRLIRAKEGDCENKEELIEKLRKNKEDELNILYTKIDKTKDKINKFESNKYESETEIKYLNQYVDKQKDELRNEKKKIKNDITSLKLEYKKANKDYNVLYNFWKYHLGREGFKNFLYNKKLRLIQYYSNEILMQMNVNLRIELEGFKRLKSGKWKKNVSVKVIDDLREWAYEERSSGEQLRIDYSTTFSFRNLISQKLGFTFDFVGFDEMFNALDKTGKEEVCDLINNISKYTDVKQSLIISHDNDIKNNFQNIIKVVKKNGITRVN